MSPTGDVTRLLGQFAEGRREALDELYPIVYEELRRIAHAKLRGERLGHTLNTTALVHEAYEKLADLDRVAWNDRVHFLAVSAKAMRHILINYALARKAQKRGGGAAARDIDVIQVVAEQRSEELLALDEALNRLEALEPRQAQVVTCRFFGGMNIEETAAALELSPATVKRDWNVARAWLNRALRP